MGEVRIIGGRWKRSKLPVADHPGLRPTPARVRETLFNWLGQDLSGWSCIDAFAGTGALGFEAASRGAAAVLLVEQEAKLIALLELTRRRLDAQQVSIERGDGVRRLQHCPAQSVDLVLLDPPFGAGLELAALAAAVPALSPAGRIYLETGARWTDEQAAGAGLQLHRHLKAGAVHGHLLICRAT